jgi:hypothetical protein
VHHRTQRAWQFTRQAAGILRHECQAEHGVVFA